MSMLNDATIVLTSADETVMRALETPQEFWSGQSFLRVTDEDTAIGGSHAYTGAVMAACFDYVDPGQVIRYLATLDWTRTQGILVMSHDWADDLNGGGSGLTVAKFPLAGAKPEAIG